MPEPRKINTKMWSYTTDTQLKEADYKFENKGRCRSCGAEIEWWLTPKQKHMPLDAGTMQPHWSTCPDAEHFRKAK